MGQLPHLLGESLQLILGVDVLPDALHVVPVPHHAVLHGVADGQQPPVLLRGKVGRSAGAPGPSPLQQLLSAFLEAAPSPALNRTTTASQASPCLGAGPKLSTGLFVQQPLLRPSEPSQLQLAGDKDGGDVLPPILVLPSILVLSFLCFPGFSTHCQRVLPSSLLTLASFPPHHSMVTALVPRSHLVANPMLSPRWSPAAYCSFQLFSHCSQVLHGPALRCPPRVYPFSPNTT